MTSILNTPVRARRGRPIADGYYKDALDWAMKIPPGFGCRWEKCPSPTCHRLPGKAGDCAFYRMLLKRTRGTNIRLEITHGEDGSVDVKHYR